MSRYELASTENSASAPSVDLSALREGAQQDLRTPSPISLDTSTPPARSERVLPISATCPTYTQEIRYLLKPWFPPTTHEYGVFRQSLVYVTVGALGWLPDLDRYFATVNRLSPGGHLFVYEMHPILDMFDTDGDLIIKHSHFRSEPFESTDDPDYYDPERIVEATSFWFHHKLSDIIGGCLRHGLALRASEEHDHDISTVFRSLHAPEPE